MLTDELICRRREDIAWTLQTLSANALELNRLWHECGYVSARLLDVATVNLLERLPVKVDCKNCCLQALGDPV